MEEMNPTQQYGAKAFDGEERRTGQQRYEGEERRKGAQVEEIPDDVQPGMQNPAPTD
jgi:hypothetical protein